MASAQSRLRAVAGHMRCSPAAEQSADGPLKGVLVVEWTTAVQGPAAGQYLSDMGASVIKIEGPVGDGNRHGRGTQNETPRAGLEPQFVSVNMGKRSLSIDMKDPASFAVVLKLLEDADVFLANFTQRALDSVGLDYETVRSKNPEIIYAVCSGFGPVGPLAGKKGFDGAAQARGGIVSITGPEEAPVMIGDVVADTGGGVQLALGIMTALYNKAKTGKGQAVKTSLYGTQLWSQRWSLTHVGMTGADLSRHGQNAYAVAPNGAGLYRCGDGKMLMLMFPIVGKDQLGAFRALCEFGGQAWLADDPRFQDPGLSMYGSPIEDVKVIQQGCRDMFESRPYAEWEDFFETHPLGKDFVWSPIQTHKEIIQEEQALVNEYIVPMKLPHMEQEVPVVGNVIALSETPGKVQGPPPMIAEHTAEIMREAGFSEEEVMRVLDHSKAELLKALGGNERVARRLTPTVKEYWGASSSSGSGKD